MCRIYGYFGARLEIGNLLAARDAQLSGGPDDQHHLSGDGWALGCNRLAIQDPETGDQPFSNAERSVHLVFNGEIYNFREIRQELEDRGVRVDGDSDGSVLVPYYELYGERFVDRLDGMFAIAIVDLRDCPTLTLFADHLAIKSVYYAAVAGGIAFASEVRGLTALAGRSFAIDHEAIDGYFDGQCLPNGATLFQGVARLCPGERLVYVPDDGPHRLSPRLDQDSAEPIPPSERSPDALRELMIDELDRMTRQAGPISLQLSGGLDSSLLATLVRRRRSDVRAFHVTYDREHPSDERAFAIDAAAHAGIPLQIVEIGDRELPDLIPQMVSALGTPNATPHALSAYVLFRAISESGHKVCFVGDGADEQFGGYRRYSTALAANDSGWMDRYLDRLSLVPEADYLRLYSPDYLAQLAPHGRSRRRALEQLRQPASSRLEQILTYDRRHKLPSLNLRKLDHLSMAHSVEARVPYCQPAVTRFARTSADALKVDGDRRKHVLWEAARGLIPSSVQTRPKQPFTFPVAVFMQPGSLLWTFITDVFASPRLCTAGYLSKGAVHNILTEHARGHDQSRLLWGLMVLELSLP
jgi:asparagine synthase (glutamine-hydrolysing)